MGTDRRGVWWPLIFVVLIPVTGCASRGSVRLLRADVATLQAKVDETNRHLAQTISTVSQTISTVKETEAGLVRQVRQAEGLGQRMGRMEERLQDIEGTIRGVKGTVDTLTVQIAKLVGRPPTAALGEAESADQLYASALAHYQSGNLGQAVLEFTDLIAGFPKHPLAEDAQFWIGAAYFAEQDFRQALLEFRKVIDQYPTGKKAPDALYKIGLSYRSLFEAEPAREVWERLIRDFPGSEAARLARSSMRARVPSPPK